MEDTNPPPDPEARSSTSEPERGLAQGAAAFLGLGIACALSLALAAGLGYLVDGWLHTSPVFTLVGLALGVVAAVMLAVTTIAKYL
jgi:F0F1-type ATP synthase assembly protein I